jgi:Uma2 family endonuclease
MAIPANARLIDGVPIFAVEILWPSDQIEAIEETVQSYLDAGVAVVWVLNPYSRIVTVYRLGQPPQARDLSEDLLGDPELPGFRVPVSDLFR